MLSRRLVRAFLEPQCLYVPAQLPPTFLFPRRARCLSTTPGIVERRQPPTAPIDPSIYDALESAASAATPPPLPRTAAAAPTSALIRPPLKPNKQAPPLPRGPPPRPAQPASSSSSTTAEGTPLPLPEDVVPLLPLLAAQAPHYATLHIHGRPYLVTQGDVVRLPFKMQGVAPGDVLRLTRASTLGSRDYTLRGSPYVDARLFRARAVVSSVESEPMRLMEKTKRRNRKIKTVKSKMRFTELTVREVHVRGLEEIAKGES